MQRRLVTRVRAVNIWLMAPLLGLSVFLVILVSWSAPAATAATSSNLNFQARLFGSNGTVVPDGTYNIDFKLYTADSTTGTVGTCTGSCVWEETRENFNGQGVQVINGYFSVNLGSVTAFSSSINWDQQLWLTMNIGGVTTGSSVTWDGEMQNNGHSIALTALPYSFIAGQLAATSGANRGTLSFGSLTNNPAIALPNASGTVCLQGSGGANGCGYEGTSGNDFIQNQTALAQAASFNINGSGQAGTSLLSPLFDAQSSNGTLGLGSSNAGAITIGNTTNSTVSVKLQNSTTAFQVQNANGDVLDVNTTNSRVGIGTNAPSDTLEVDGNIVSKGTTWTARTSAADNVWNSVTYGNGRFVAVSDNGTGNRIMTSPDGINWTTRTDPVDNTWESVTYGNGLFVAIANSGTGNRIMTSPDGINWTIRTSPADNNWLSVTYGNGLFVAVSSDGGTNQVMTSPDGINWTIRTSAASNLWEAVTYGNGLFVAVAASGTGNRVMTSPDGINWTSRSSTSNDTWLSVTYGNGLFVAVNNNSNRIMTSPDGITWTSRTSASSASSLNSVTYGNGLFVAVGTGSATNGVQTSPDGINWTLRIAAASLIYDSVTYGNGTFVAVAGSGSGNRVMTSGREETVPFSANNAYQGGITVHGSSTFQSDANSTTAFQVQNSSGTALLTADTSNLRLGVDVTYASMGTSFSVPSVTDAGAGSLTSASQYYYKITAIDSAGGETTPSAEGTLGTGHTALNVSWQPITGASGYKIYRSTSSGAEVYYTTVLTNSFKDTGQFTAGSATPPAANTAYISTTNANSDLQLAVGGNGTPTGQLYVSGTQPLLVGQTADSNLNGPVSVVVQGKYAYLTNFTGNKLSIYDISNPADPLFMGSSTTSLNGPNGLVVQGKYAYIANQTGNKIEVFDVSDPKSPTRVGENADSDASAVAQLYVAGRYLYTTVNTGGASNKLLVYDISNPALPVLAGQNTSDSLAPYGAITGYGKFLYATSNNNNAVDVYDASNPTQPVAVGSVNLGSNPDIRGLKVVGRYAYALANNTLFVLDVGSTANPVIVGQVSTNLNGVQGLSVQGRYAYVANSTGNKLSVYDISNPASPFFVAQNSDSALNSPKALVVTGRYAYIANQSGNNLLVYDLGGTYSQQLEAGGAELGSLQVDGSGTVAGSFSVQGSLNLGGGLQASGNVSVTGGTYLQGGTILGGGNNALGTPTITSVTPTGGTATTWGYKLTAINATGGETAASAEVTTAAGAATLDGSHFNTISWSAVPGASGYKVYRTTHGTSPNTTGLIGATTSTSFIDTGLAGGGNTPPSIDTTGQLTVQGSALFANSSNSTTAFQVQNAAGGSLLNVDSTNSVISLNGNNSGELQAWQSTNTLGTAVRENDSVVLNGYIYSIGGRNGSTIEPLVQYAKVNTDGSTGGWATTTALPANREEPGLVTANGYIYVIGGDDGSSPQTTVYFAKPNPDGTISAWLSGTPLSNVRQEIEGQALASNGYLYVIGGKGSAASQSTILYAKLNADGSTGSWTTAANSLPLIRQEASVTIANGYMYLFGGDDGTTTFKNVFYAPINSDGSPGTWLCEGTNSTDCGTATITNSNSMPVVEQNAMTLVSNGYVYELGGTDGGSNFYDNVYYAKLNADGSTGAWSTSVNTFFGANARRQFGAASLNGYMYVVGGAASANTAQSTVYYTSTARVKIAGAVDLVAAAGQNEVSGGGGASLTAGDTRVVGQLSVSGQTILGGGLGVAGVSNLADTLVRSASNSATTFQVQNSSSSTIINVDTSSTANLVTNGGFEGASVTGWTSGASTLAQTNTQQWQGNNSLSVATTTSSPDGAFYIGYTLIQNQQYTLSFYAKVSSGSITDMIAGHENNTTNGLVNCLSAQTVTTTWTRFSCTFQDNTTVNTNFIYVAKSGVSAETFYLDGVQLQTGPTATVFDPGGSIQLSGIINSPLAFQNKSNSTTAFQVQNAAGTSIFNIDTATPGISLGANTTISGTNTLTVNGGLTTLGAGVTETGTALFKANSATGFQVQDSSSSKVVMAVDTSADQVVLGSASNLNGELTFASSAGTGTATITLAANPSTNYSYQLPTTTVSTGQCLQAGTVSGSNVPLTFGACGASGTFLNKNSTDTSSANAGSGYLYGFTNSGSAGSGGVLSLDNGTNTGSVLTVKGTSTSALKVQNSGSGQVLDVDTSGNQLILGQPGPSGVNGALLFQNSSNSNGITINSTAANSSYTLTLPSVAPAGGLCIETQPGTPSQLIFASCSNNNASIQEVHEWDANNTNIVSVSPTTAGDEMVLTTQIPTSSVTVSSVSGGGVTTWNKIVANNGNGTVNRVEMWAGTVTSLGSSNITVTYSSSPGAEEVTATEYTAAGVNSNTSWGVESSASQLNSTASATVTFPNMTAINGSELYVGYAQVQNPPATAGSSSGFSYIQTSTQHNIIAYNTSLAANTAYQPTANQNSSGQSNTVSAILTAFVTSSSINNTTSLQKANFYVQAATSGTVAGVLQAASSGTADILDLRNSGSANVLSVSSAGNVTIQPAASATALQVLNGSSYSVLTADTSGNQVLLGTSSHLSGQLTFNDSGDSNTISFVAPSSVAASYSLTLPTNTPTAGLCLGTSPSNANQLIFASCATQVSAAGISYVSKWQNTGTGNTNVTDSPVTKGDLLVLFSHTTGNATISGISGGGPGSWTKITTYNSAGGTQGNAEIWRGVVSTTGSGTVAVTYSGTVTASDVAVEEFTMGSTNGTWAIDTSGTSNSTSATTINYPTLTPQNSSELYTGYAWGANTMSAGSTSGFTYLTTAASKYLAYDPSVTGGTAYTPQASQSVAGAYASIAAAIEAYAGTSVIVSGTATQEGNFNVQAATSGTVAGVLQAASSGTADVLDVKDSSGNNVMSVNTSNVNGVDGVTLGTSNSVGGQLTFNSAGNSNSITIEAPNAPGADYYLTLPTTTPAPGQCLATSPSNQNQLVFSSCANQVTSIAISLAANWKVSTSGLSPTLTVSPTNLGDLMTFFVFANKGNTINSVSGGGVTSWSRIVTANSEEMWRGIVTSTGSSTISVSLSTPSGPTDELAAQEWTTGSATGSWVIDSSGTISNASSTTVTYPSLTPQSTKDLYIGYAIGSSTMSAGSTTGYTYLTGGGTSNMGAYNTTVSTTTQPTASQSSSGTSIAAAALIAAYSSSSVISNSTVTQEANFNIQAATSGSVAGTLQAFPTGTGDVLDILDGNGTLVDKFGYTGNLLVEPSTASAHAFQVQTTGGVNVLSADTSANQVVVGAGATGESSPSILVLDNETGTSSDPTEVNGAMYYNATTHTFRCGAAGAWQNCSGLISANTSQSSANSNCSSSCAAFSTSASIPANYCQPGRVLKLTANGYFSSQATSTNLQFGVYYGTDGSIASNDVLLGSLTPAEAVSSASNNAFSINFNITCFSTTSMQTGGTLDLQIGSSAAGMTAIPMNATSGTTVVSTSTKNLYIFPVWSAASASDTATITQLVVNSP